MAKWGWNFRNSIAFKTDGTNQTWAIGGGTDSRDVFPTSRGGLPNFGFVGAGVFSWDSRDRNSGFPVELAGMAYKTDFNGNERDFRVTLPSAGDYKIRLALGDSNEGRTIYAQIFDNTTVRSTFDTTTSGSNRWRDATNTELTEVTWPTSNAQITLTFATTTFLLRWGDGVSKTAFISHLEIEEVGAVAVAVGALGQRILRRRMRG